jgi:hypothetical protein
MEMDLRVAEIYAKQGSHSSGTALEPHSLIPQLLTQSQGDSVLVLVLLAISMRRRCAQVGIKQPLYFHFTLPPLFPRLIFLFR